MQQKWARNNFDVENDAYETLAFAYSKKMDQLISTIIITTSKVEEKSSPPYPKDAMTNSEEKMTNLEDTMHVDNYTTLQNGFQQNERPTNGIQLSLIYLEQNLAMPLKFKIIGKLDKRKV